MAVITTAVKLYSGSERKVVAALLSHIERLCSGLEVTLASAGLTDRGWVRIELSGKDEEFTSELLRRQLGMAVNTFEDLVEGSVITGRIVDSGKIGYGLYVETGSSQVGDALYPLHEMRRQLAGGRKLPAREIISSLLLVDNLPLEVQVKRVDKPDRKIWVSLTPQQLRTLMRPLNDHLERLVVLGATRPSVIRSLEQSGHMRDTLWIESLGFLEHRIVCKEGTQAKGLVPEIGSHLETATLFVMTRQKLSSFHNTEEAHSRKSL